MVFLGLANPRRMKLRRGTFLRFGHRPVLRNLAKLLATISMICNTESAWRVTSVTAPARYLCPAENCIFADVVPV